MAVCTLCIYLHDYNYCARDLIYKIYSQSKQIKYYEEGVYGKAEKGTEIETKTGNWKMEMELLKTELEKKK